MIELTQVKNSNHLFKSMRLFQKDRTDFAVLFSSPWDDQCSLILNELNKGTTDTNFPVLSIDSFETPDLFSINDKIFSCVKTPACYFYKYDKRIREYRVFKEVLPSRILQGFGVFEWFFADLKKVRNFFIILFLLSVNQSKIIKYDGGEIIKCASMIRVKVA